jgi:hypothetical protein
MAASPRSKALTVADLEQEQADIEHAIMLAERASGQARQNLKDATAQADTEAISDARSAMRTAEAKASSLRSDLAVVVEQLDQARELYRQRSQQDRFAALQRLRTALILTSESLEGATVKWAAERDKHLTAAREFENEIRRCGVTVDASLSVSLLLDGRLSMLVYLETDGAHGRSRSLETPTQIRQSRRASLVHAATDFSEFSLRLARAQLGLSAET